MAFNKKEVYGESSGDLLKASDIPADKDIRCKIESWEVLDLPDFNDKSKINHRVTLKFVGKEKKLVLNVTNFEIIEKNFEDDDPDNWIGKEILVYQGEWKDRSDGQMKPCLKVKDEIKREEASADDLDFGFGWLMPLPFLAALSQFIS